MNTIPELPPFDFNELSVDNINIIENAVPHDLIPTNATQFTSQWATDTFKYAHIFVSSIVGWVFQNEEELHLWIAKARELSEELKAFGFAATVNYICKDMENRGITLPDSNNCPKNYNDIFVIFENEEWYKSNLTLSRETIFRYCWGIFRRGSDEWIHEHISNWLNQKGISIMYDTNKRNTRKNFVYANFCKKICTCLSDRIIHVMTRRYGEYLCVRKSKRDDIAHKEMCMMGHKCWLVTIKQQQQHEGEDEDRTEDLKRKINSLFDEIQQLTNNEWAYDILRNQTPKKPNLEGFDVSISEKGKCDVKRLIFDNNTYMNFIYCNYTPHQFHIGKTDNESSGKFNLFDIQCLY